MSRNYSRAFGLQPESRGSFFESQYEMDNWKMPGCRGPVRIVSRLWSAYSSSVLLGRGMPVYLSPALAAVMLQGQSWVVGVRLCDHRIWTSAMCFMEKRPWPERIKVQEWYTNSFQYWTSRMKLQSQGLVQLLNFVFSVLCSLAIMCSIPDFPIGLHQNVLPQENPSCPHSLGLGYVLWPPHLAMWLIIIGSLHLLSSGAMLSFS